MTPERLASLAAYAGDRLHPTGPTGPHPFGPAVPLTSPKAIYIVCAWSGRIIYVGSTTVGAGARIGQHLGDQAKTLDWSTVYIVPLSVDTPVEEVRRIEGRIGLVTRPGRNKALPRINALSRTA